MKIKGVFSTLELGVNNFCSLSCEGCPSLKNSHRQSRHIEFLPVIAILKRFHFDEIVLCGNDGEPLEHPDINELLFKLLRAFHDTKIRVVTNGEKLKHVFTDRDLLQMKERVSFDIAVDGSTQEIHQLTRKDGDLNRVLSSIAYLKDLGVFQRVIVSRHRDNECDNLVLAKKIVSEFSLAPFFRDTSVVTTRVKPPSKISKNSDVSILYSRNNNKVKYLPKKDYLYIDSNGDCFPCVSFVKYKFTYPRVNIFSYKDTSIFFEDYMKFREKFCFDYQENGDLRQCQLNCGIYRNDYSYDTLSDIEELYD